MATKRRVIVLSADAMVSEDLEVLRKMENYSKFLAGGAEIKTMRSIYPTSTYPIHVTMATGTYPKDHGVTANTKTEVGVLNLPWHWFQESIQVSDIFHAAHTAGLKTAAVFWPVTGNHPTIDCLIPEYWTQGEDDTLLNAFSRAGSSEEMLAIIKRHQHSMVERTHPMCDDFIINCACDIIVEHTPDLLMIHPANIDGYRHQFGLFNDRVLQGIEETDRWIGQLMGACEEAGILDEVTFILLSDHGQLEIRRQVNPNVLFAQHGLITLDEQGSIADWDAYCYSSGMSALVYLADPGDSAVYAQVASLLTRLRDEGVWGIGELFTEEEARMQHHLGGPFSFVLETDGYSAFGNRWDGPYAAEVGSESYIYRKATHGYLPHKGPQPIFVAKGPGIAERVNLEQGALIDVAPTIASLLGVELPRIPGVAIDAVLVHQ